MEAVREAYRQIQDRPGDDQPLPGPEGRAAPASPSQRPGQSLGLMSTAESGEAPVGAGPVQEEGPSQGVFAADVPTAAELLRPIVPEEEPPDAGSPSPAGSQGPLPTHASVHL